jgi:hypothetical protein
VTRHDTPDDDRDTPSSRAGSSDERADWRLLALVGLSTLVGAVHHLDHIVRGNHVGWPVIPEVTTFTFSLVFYPLVALGLVLTLTGRVDARYWLAVSGGGLLTVSLVHFGPWAVEPPHHVTGPHESALVSALALAVVGALVVTLLVATGYAASRWQTDGSGPA